MESQFTSDGSTMPDLLYHLPYSELTIQSDEAMADSSSPPVPLATLDVASMQSTRAAVIVTQIEDIFEVILDSILNRDKQMSIQMRTRPKKVIESDQKEDSTSRKPRTRIIKFPTKSAAEARRFSTCHERDCRSLLT